LFDSPCNERVRLTTAHHLSSNQDGQRFSPPIRSQAKVVTGPRSSVKIHRRYLCVRLGLFSLFGLIWLCSLTPAAHAGCHIASPPVALHQLVASLAEPAHHSIFALKTTVIPPTTVLVPMPCEDETATPPIAPATSLSPSASLIPRQFLSPTTSQRLDVPDSELNSATRPSRLDRPPR
jgi:hypothetical protein